ncbi:MAG: hypothetical protein KDI71_11595 [Xanthomonadales bacterium]|nr:hypothetical protein [Xanthomonadales bacterium]
MKTGLIGLLFVVWNGMLCAANLTQTPDPAAVLTGQTAQIFVQLTAGDGTRAVTYTLDYDNAVYSNAFAQNERRWALAGLCQPDAPRWRQG